MLTGQEECLVSNCCPLHGTRITSNKEILYLKIGIKSDAYIIKMLTQTNLGKV